MEYNYAREKRRFDAEWKRKERWYMKEGMSGASHTAQLNIRQRGARRDDGVSLSDERGPKNGFGKPFCDESAGGIGIHSRLFEIRSEREGLGQVVYCLFQVGRVEVFVFQPLKAQPFKAAPLSLRQAEAVAAGEQAGI